MTEFEGQLLAAVARAATALDRIATALERGTPTPAPAPAPAAKGASSRGSQRTALPAVTNFPNYGRAKGAPISGASLEDLEFYGKRARESLDDPSKSRWHEREGSLLAAIQTELRSQGVDVDADF